MATDLFKKKLDPDNELRHRKVDGGEDIECTYKGSRVSYDDYLDIHAWDWTGDDEEIVRKINLRN